MPTYVSTERCDGCEGRKEAACVDICPHDLMRLDPDGSATGNAGKAYNQEPEQCWECYACVKACPRQALECRHYADVVPLGASVQPLRGPGSITWHIRFRNGSEKQFTFPIRTTPEGSADPYGGEKDAVMEKISDHAFLFTGNTHRCDPGQFIER